MIWAFGEFCACSFGGAEQPHEPVSRADAVELAEHPGRGPEILSSGDGCDSARREKLRMSRFGLKDEEPRILRRNLHRQALVRDGCRP